MLQYRLNRIRELIDWLDKTSHAERRDTLEVFAERHRVQYNTIKDDATALGYALDERDMRFVPKTRRKEVRDLREAIARGEINKVDAGAAIYDYVMMTPVTDVERLNRLYPLTDPESRKIQERVTELIQKIAEEKVLQGTHPIRAQSEAWRQIGGKIHYELSEAVHTVPKEQLPTVARDIWANNFIKAQGELHYEKARSKVSKRLGWELGSKGKGPSMPVWWKKFLEVRYGKACISKATPEQIHQRMVSDYKNVRRHRKLGHERPVPKEFRNALKDIRERSKFQEFRTAGRHYHTADVIWGLLKQREKSLPESLRTGKKKKTVTQKRLF